MSQNSDVDLTDRLSRGIFITALAFVILAGVFLSGAFAYRNDVPPIPQLKLVYQVVGQMLRGESPATPRDEHLQPTRNQGDGVTTNTVGDDGALVLLSGFFEGENQIRLIRRDGTVVKKWPLNYLEHFPDSDTRTCDLSTPLEVDVHGALATPAGEVVFNYEYCGTVKLDQCGKVLWAIDEITHHSLVPATEGGYWLLGRELWLSTDHPDRFPPFSNTGHSKMIKDDMLLRIDEDGKILEQVSVAEILRAGGLEAELTAAEGSYYTGFVGRSELVHTNKVAELTPDVASAFPLFTAGDLAMSFRRLNLIVVIDPVTKAVKWHQTGPWIRQHDVEFRRDGRLSIFNNNTYRTAYSPRGHVLLNTPFTTNMIAVDPVTRETEILFGERPGQEMLSVIRGQHELLPGGGMIITEFDAGRVLEVDAAGEIVWEFVNRFDDDFVGEIMNADVYSADYFQADWAACE
jgi:Arylsulfotransferase (ASST)